MASVGMTVLTGTCLAVLAFNLAGDAVRDILDPRLRIQAASPAPLRSRERGERHGGIKLLEEAGQEACIP